MSDLSAVERELEERFGRPLTDEERAHLHENAARAAAAYAEAAAIAETVPAEAAHSGDAVYESEPAGSVYGSVRRAARSAGPTDSPGAGPGAAGAAGPGAGPGATPPPAASGLTARLRRLATPLIAGAFAVAKWSAIIFKLKFLGLFISIAAFQFLWRSWWLAIGFIGLIFVHELGHMLEARRQGMPVSWPQFVPFLGAYVVLKERPVNAYRSALISLAGPVLGSAAAVACWGAAEASGSQTLKALAHLGIFINLLNLAPIGFLDGGKITDALEPRVWLGVIAVLGIVAAVIHNGILIIALILGALEVWGRWKRIDERARNPYYQIGGRRMAAVAVLYVGLAVLLVAGFEATNIPR